MLKDKKIVRRLALLLCLSLLVGLVPTGILSVPVVVNAVSASVLANGDFEQGTEGWKNAQVSENAGRTGAALVMSDAVKTKDVETVVEGRAPVAPGETYTLSLYAKRDPSDTNGKSATAYVIWYDKDGNLNEPAGTDINGKNQKWCKTFSVVPASSEWELFEFDVTVPEGAATTGIRFYVEKAFSGMIYIDDVVLAKTGEAPETPDANLEVIYTDGFEYTITDFWDRNHTNVMTWIPDTGYQNSHVIEGSRVLLMQSYSTKDAGQIATSKPIAIEGGATYTLNYSAIEHWAYVGSSAGKADVKMIFTDASGNVLSSVTKPATCEAGSNAKNWIAREVVAEAPANAKYLKIEFNTSPDAYNILYLVDALSISKGGDAPAATDPTESQPAATTPSEPAVSGAVANGNFESGLDGWNANELMSVNTADKHSGEASLQFAVTEAQGGRFVKQVVSVVPGKTYNLSAWVKVLEGKGGYIGLYGIGGANAAIAFSTLEVGAWTKVSLDVTIPHGYTSVEVEFGTNSNQVVTFLLDDIQLIETDAPIAPTEPEITVPTEPAGEKIFADDFSNDFNPEGSASTCHLPVGWTASQHSAAIGTATYDKALDGSKNLCIQDAKDKWIQSPLIEVVEGYEYTITYAEHKYQPTKKGAGGYAKVVFVDKDGNFLKEYEVEAGQTKIWEQGIILSKAPAGATHMYIEFGLRAPTGEPTYSVDNLAVYAVEAEVGGEEPTKPTEPTVPVDPMKPFADNFENPADPSDLNAGPKDWMSNDDGPDAFGTMVSLVNNALNYDGNYLRLGKTGTWSITSPEFPVQIGYSYSVKFMARKLVDNTNFNGVVELVFVNTRGKIVESHTSVAGKTYGEWVEETLSAVAPIGAYKAYVILRVENTDRRVDADFAVDNFAVVRAEEPTFEYEQEATEPIIYNQISEDTFSESYVGGASTVRIPVGWTSSAPNSAALGVGNYDKYEGSSTLFIQNKGDKYMRSEIRAAKGGYNYLVSYVEKKYQGHIAAEGGYMKIVFVDANGEAVGWFEETAGYSKTWTDMEYEYTAPEAAAGYYIEFGLKSCSGGDPTYGVDNLVIYESAEKVSNGETPDAPGGETPEETLPGGSGNDSGSEGNNPNGGDSAALLTVSAMMVAIVAMAVLVLKKLRFF